MSGVAKRSTTIHGHRTSFSLEDEFFTELERLAVKRAVPLAALVAEIDAGRPGGINLSSALRLYILDQVKREARN